MHTHKTDPKVIQPTAYIITIKIIIIIMTMNNTYFLHDGFLQDLEDHG